MPMSSAPTRMAVAEAVTCLTLCTCAFVGGVCARAVWVVYVLGVRVLLCGSVGVFDGLLCKLCAGALRALRDRHDRRSFLPRSGCTRAVDNDAENVRATWCMGTATLSAH